jgi:hypothetical protein
VRALARTENGRQALVLVAREAALSPTVARRLGTFVADARFNRAPTRLGALVASGLGALQRVGNVSEVGES